MPLFLRALPLSLGTLWHYVFLLPLVLILCIPFVLLTLIPLVGMLVSSGIVTFVSIVGYRCALTAFGRGNEPAFGKLVRSSLALGLINTIAGVLLLFVSVGLALGLSLLGFDPQVPTPGMELLPVVSGLSVLLYLVLNSVYTCAMAVPMTAVAAAATRNGRDPGPFFAFGSGLVSLGFAWFLWLGGLFFLGFFGVLMESVQAGMQEVNASVLGVVPEEPVSFRPVLFVAAMLYLLWGACWFCATAVLAWDKEIKRRDALRVEVVDVARMTSDELRALRESRMQRDDGVTH